jgi:hypothetical protein
VQLVLYIKTIMPLLMRQAGVVSPFRGPDARAGPDSVLDSLCFTPLLPCWYWFIDRRRDLRDQSRSATKACRMHQRRATSSLAPWRKLALVSAAAVSMIRSTSQGISPCVAPACARFFSGWTRHVRSQQASLHGRPSAGSQQSYAKSYNAGYRLAVMSARPQHLST